MYLDDKKKEQILEAADLLEVAEDYGQLKSKGNAMVQDCPSCGSKGKMSFNKAKGIFKCWVCEISGKDAVAYLMQTQGVEWLKAMEMLADRYNIDVSEGPKNKQKRKRGLSFCDSQLHASGIPKDAITYFYKANETTEVSLERYERGTVDKHFNVSRTGDDMIIHYLDLDFNPIQYIDSRGKSRNFIRVRYANPSLHMKDGKAPKYMSPPGGGNQLYIPNGVVKAVKQGQIIDTLIVTEGEKKADKLTVHNMPAVGISGIHNFSSSSSMPKIFEQIIHECAVKRVVFLLDSDWKHLKARPDKSVDQRPRTFASAVIKFKDYFKSFAVEGYDLDLFFGSHQNNLHKGIDDLLVYTLKGKESDLKSDLDKTILDREGQGELLWLKNVSTWSNYKIQELWGLEKKQSFFKMHKAELEKLGVFKYGKIRHRVADNGQVVLDEPILPNERYWEEIVEEVKGQVRTRYIFSYQGIRVFLRNRGFGKLKLDKDAYRFIYMDGKIVQEIGEQDIKDFIIEFSESLDKKEVLELVLRGSSNYLGQSKLLNMYQKQPQFMDPERGLKYLVFKNIAWKITPDSITKVAIGDLPGHVWQDRIIDFEPKLMSEPLFQIEEGDRDWDVSFSDKMWSSELACFLSNTSNNAWRKEGGVKHIGNGVYDLVDKDPQPDYEDHEQKSWKDSLVRKLLATGYMMSDYRDRANMKAIVAMDAAESEVGMANGGTGKSIWCTMFKHISKIFVIDGKEHKLNENKFLFEGVDERTSVIVVDDCKINMNFEDFWSKITAGLTVNGKGLKSFRIDPPPYFIFSTNHALKGDDNSTRRRQFTVSFSDYYGPWRTPKDDFGRLLFYEWDDEQWNLFYNFMATCLQAYMKIGLPADGLDDSVRVRKLRQDVGEEFIEWADLYFMPDNIQRNKPILRKELLQSFHDHEETIKKFYNNRRFKKAMRKYCVLRGLDFNPHKEGEDDKRNGAEYFTIGDESFDYEIWKTYTDAY